MSNFHNWINNLKNKNKRISCIPYYFYYGRLIQINGILIEAVGLKVPIGTTCFIEYKIEHNFTDVVESEVVGFKNEKILLAPMKHISNYTSGAKVYVYLSIKGEIFNRLFAFGHEVLGRVFLGNGDILDDKLYKLDRNLYKSLYKSIINPLFKSPINKVLDVGIRAINGLITIGRGQRIGIFAGSGVGKSVLINMIASYTEADIIIVNLIGERSREIKNFIDNITKKNVLNKVVTIVSPSDTTPILKINGAQYAASLAEYFRDLNKNVLLIMDSLTRYAMAQREISLSMGEIPINKGYPPSVFSKISSLLERMGNGTNQQGSITAFYTVLMEEDDHYDPIVDSTKAMLDGHIFLSKELADSGHYPAIDIESSISRTLNSLLKPDQINKINYLKKLISIYKKNKDLIKIGAYIHGTDDLIDKSIFLKERIQNYLCQDMSSRFSYQRSYQDLLEIFN